MWRLCTVRLAQRHPKDKRHVTPSHVTERKDFNSSTSSEEA
eukprot:CAMPEP_0194490260 /NCGR_PEP_ID=MMETSP0253-20130528/9541_1 /TAXON_ID=2966 /ORGANISM="Noctiluca scintillans" /LENGTH=40 /DNA_ID= /DNA_START= /DNA_END= /DNA_ORIENTATION=